ncbi:unnamed protein product [Nezara viridula]|uniref:Neuropeptide n=1 Tax=Nezara viridula TaxID=85310 RepID=A0A9P0H0G3_NEZVI|nr:unnamed protein product [Nezara viridula]
MWLSACVLLQRINALIYACDRDGERDGLHCGLTNCACVRHWHCDCDFRDSRLSGSPKCDGWPRRSSP